MSVKMIGWAWDVRVDNPTRKLVLVALADHANGDGVCWPSMQKIAALAECSVKSVQRHIDALEEMGVLTRTRRARNREGKYGGYEYTLAGPGAAVGPASGQETGGPSPQDTESAGPPDENATDPQDSLTDGHSDLRSESPLPPDTESAGPGDSESGGLKKEEPSVGLEPSENRHGGGFPTRGGDGRIVDAIVAWAKHAQLVRNIDPDRPVETFRWALQLAEDELGRGATFDRIARQLVVEYVTQIDGTRPEPSAITHINRLVGSHGAPLTLRAVAEALDNGAGADAEYAGDARAVIKYATAVILRWRREGTAA